MTHSRADDHSLLHLLSPFRDSVWWYLRLLGADHATADDLAQETLLAVSQSNFVHEADAATKRYLRSSAYRLWLAEAKRMGRETPDEEIAERVFEEWQPDAETGPRMTALEICLKQLEGRSRRALELRYGEGRSVEEIAKQLSLGHAGANSLLQRTRDALRRCMEMRLKNNQEHPETGEAT